ncbi:MAG: response regulator transcription factor [Polaromonas sp.]
MSNLQTTQPGSHAPHGADMTGAPDAGLPPSDSAMLPEAPAPRLTSRQCEVLSLLCEGLPDKLIARRLDLSHHTVRGHVQILYGLLRVSNRMQAVFAARQRGLIN